MNVLVTGCYGFIGANLTNRLLNEGHIVYGIDKLTKVGEWNRRYIGDFTPKNKFRFIQGDISSLQELPDHLDFVINTAAESHVGNSILDNHNFVLSNVEGVRVLMELIRKKPDNIRKKPVLIHFSTDEVYGNKSIGQSFETDFLAPTNPYSATKAAADMLVNSWKETYNLEVITVRPSNNYGIYQYPEKFIPLIVYLGVNGREVRLHNGGAPFRTWLHVEDTIDAIFLLMEKGKPGEIYNIPGTDLQQNLEVFEKISELLPFKIKADLEHKRVGQDFRYSVNGDKLKALGWSQKRNFDDSIQDIVLHYLHRASKIL